MRLIIVGSTLKINAKYVRLTLTALKLCKLYAKFNAKYVRSTLKFNAKYVRFNAKLFKIGVDCVEFM